MHCTASVKTSKNYSSYAEVTGSQLYIQQAIGQPHFDLFFSFTTHRWQKHHRLLRAQLIEQFEKVKKSSPRRQIPPKTNAYSLQPYMWRHSSRASALGQIKYAGWQNVWVILSNVHEEIRWFCQGWSMSTIRNTHTRNSSSAKFHIHVTGYLDIFNPGLNGSHRTEDVSRK